MTQRPPFRFFQYDPEQHHRRSLRLQGYDYSRSGSYFITLCTYKRQPVFGKISNGIMQHSPLGEVAAECWQAIPAHYPDVELDAWIIMPDHIHGIIHIRTQPTTPRSPRRIHQYQQTIPRSVGCIVRGFKIGVTKWARHNTPIYRLWHHNFHERIIRNDTALHRIQRYIINNPRAYERRRHQAMGWRASR